MSTAYQLTPSMPLFAFAFLLTLGLCVYAGVRYLRHDRRPVILAFAVLMAAVSSWELLNFLADAVTAEQLKLLSKNLTNAVSYTLYIYGLLAFSLAYTDNNRWIRWVALACAVHLVGMSTALFVAPELLYESNGLTTKGAVTIAGFSFEQFVSLDRTLNPAFVLLAIHGQLLTLTAGAVFVQHFLRAQQTPDPGQIGMILLGIGAPMVSSFLLLSGLAPPAWNPTDFSFVVTAIVFALAVFRYRLFRLVPVGRQQVVRMMNDPVVLTDDDDRVVDSNQAARDLFAAGSDWRGATAASFFGPLAEQILRSRDTTDAETETLVSQDDGDRYFDLNTTPIWTPTDEVGGRLIVLREVTELIESRHKVQRQNERLNEFADIVAHDLRNPMTGAVGFLEIARKTNESQHFDRVEQSLGRMEELIDELLLIARGNRQAVNIRTHQLQPIVEEAWSYTDAPKATLSADGPLGEIQADETRLLQLFGNLFRNSIEHGGDNITAEVGLLADGEGFYVADDGPGFSEKNRTEFEAFADTDEISWAGIGLMSVTDVVEAHGWDLSVPATEQGARVEIRAGEQSE
ncbi:PAS domain-containing protein [Halobellus sp. Atlit-31R]|nr:PAS domain-containing protein [Halobellus sp. Atlit-31R]